MFKSRYSRLLTSTALFSTLLLANAAKAQNVTPDLPIPTPPDATIQLEIDARQEDLLGLAKSLINGLQKAAASHPEGTAALTTGTASNEAAFFKNLLTQDFSKVLKDVNHIHVVAYTTNPSTPLDLQSFYEFPWAQTGGRRLAWVNAGPGQRLLIVGFSAPRGFAAVVQMPGQIVAVRADGYPDLEALSPILMTAFMYGTRSVVQTPATIEARPMPPATAVRPPVKPAARVAPKRR